MEVTSHGRCTFHGLDSGWAVPGSYTLQFSGVGISA